LTLRDHVRSQTAVLLRRFAFQVRQAATRPDEEAVHDLRVSIRRLRECLRMFEEIYPSAPRKKIRRELRKLMKSAEAVRSDDIALGLLKKAGLDDKHALVLEVRARRGPHRAVLHEELTALRKRPFTRVWRQALEL
jgi:CHAD domain-containing protein